ncbi:MAG TPA: glyoxalase [Hyphomonadaceae bacterium]|nr:glyoxalase [Hyphomonadaceae bacterium]
MAKVIGIGGLFFKASDTQATMQWYVRVLGLELTDWGGVVFQPAGLAAHPGAGTVFNAMAGDTDYFAPSTKDFMFNFVVDDLDGVLARCKAEGVEPVKLFPDEGMGRFAHIMDPDGRKIELWQPKPMPAAATEGTA